jgi:hypothetical protein
MIRAALHVSLAICYAAFHYPAVQAPRVELDHVFVVVQPGAAVELAALQCAGLTVAPKVAKHPGQGTASQAVFFENAYLELIWVDSSVAIDKEHASAAQWFRDAAAWRTSGHSPFGLGLRRLPGDTAALPVPVTRESAEWLEPGTAYELLRQPNDSLAAEFFVVPASRSVPNWIASLKERAPQLLQHPGGGHEITRVRVHGPVEQHPTAFRALLPRPVEMVGAAKTLLEVELDKGARGERVDLRPDLPLVIVR